METTALRSGFQPFVVFHSSSSLEAAVAAPRAGRSSVFLYACLHVLSEFAGSHQGSAHPFDCQAQRLCRGGRVEGYKGMLYCKEAHRGLFSWTPGCWTVSTHKVPKKRMRKLRIQNKDFLRKNFLALAMTTRSIHSNKQKTSVLREPQGVRQVFPLGSRIVNRFADGKLTHLLLGDRPTF